jgi:hypothetical protein
MKKLTMSILIALAASVSAQTFEAPAGPKKARKAASPPPVAVKEGRGAVQRGIRGGNPLQMLNPKAPAKYGVYTDSLSIDPDTGKWKGIKLFEIFF